MREIAELVASGRTNREIAERLFLSTKTVETHLSRVFVKLSVRPRAGWPPASRPAAATDAVVANESAATHRMILGR